MKTLLNFIIEHWAEISVLLYELLARLIPTKKNWSLIDLGFKLLNKVVPNIQKKALTVFILLFPIVGFSQLNGNFKSVRFVNQLDSTQVLPINGSIYYNEQSDKFRVYENNVWKDLINPGGGGNFTASNGLTKVGNDIRLGGNLSSQTIIGTGSTSFSIDYSGIDNLSNSNFGDGIFDLQSLNFISGGSGQFQFSADNTILTTPNLSLTINNNPGINGQVLTSNGSSAFWQTPSGGGGSPGGANTAVQFNNSGTFGGGNLSYSGTSLDFNDVNTNTLSNSGNLTLRSINQNVTLNSSGSLYQFTPSLLQLPQNNTITSFGGGTLSFSTSGGAFLTGEVGTRVTTTGSQTLSGNLELFTGAGALGFNGSTGNIIIAPGLPSGSGTKGFIILPNLPTSCAGAPSGALANIAGTLTICP